MDIFEKNQLFLEKLSQKLSKSVEYQHEEALRIKDSSDNPESFDLIEWLNNKQNYILSYEFLPRSLPGRQTYMEFKDKYMHQGVSKYINDDECDPHLMVALANLSCAIEDAGFDPFDAITVSTTNINTLVVFGTGNGKILKQVLEWCKPNNLFIFVSSWNELVSSFWEIDWVDLWNYYCNSEEKKILVNQSDSSSDIKAYLQGFGFLTLDHALILRANSSYEQTIEMSYDVLDSQLARAALYTGFVMDEYNMIWNTWRSLTKSPRIYENPANLIGRSWKPAKTLRAVVTASGPSLDQSIDSLKRLKKDHVIIACASSYGTLIANDIIPDFLCLLERGDFMISQYRQVAREVGSRTRLLASTTTPSKLYELFRNPMIYFRSQLTPTGLFADSTQCVLPYEGPQTINTGVSFACSVGFDSILLVGADLGAADLDVVRSRNAVGHSPRTFDIKVPGNLRDYVYTNEMLIDGKMALQDCVRHHADGINLYNMSDGVRIEGFKPITSDEYFSGVVAGYVQPNMDKESLFAWWDNSRLYSYARFVARFKALKPRRIVNKYINSLIAILNGDGDWISCKSSRLENALNLSSIPLREQFAVRAVRGQVIRYCIALYRQMIVLRKNQDDPNVAVFVRRAEEILVESLESIRRELFELIDTLENLSPSD